MECYHDGRVHGRVVTLWYRSCITRKIKRNLLTFRYMSCIISEMERNPLHFQKRFLYSIAGKEKELPALSKNVFLIPLLCNAMSRAFLHCNALQCKHLYDGVGY